VDPDKEKLNGHEEERSEAHSSADNGPGLTKEPEVDEADEAGAGASADDELGLTKEPEKDEASGEGTGAGNVGATGADTNEGSAQQERQINLGGYVFGADYVPPEDQRVRIVDTPVEPVSFETKVADWIVYTHKKIHKMRQDVSALPLPLRFREVRRVVRGIQGKAPPHLYKKGADYPPYKLDTLLGDVVRSIAIRHQPAGQNRVDEWGYTDREAWRELYSRLTGFIREYEDNQSALDISDKTSQPVALYAVLRKIAVKLMLALYSNRAIVSRARRRWERVT